MNRSRAVPALAGPSRGSEAEDAPRRSDPVKRPLHLIIVSYPSRLDATLEKIAHTLARGAGEERVVERAQQASDVRYLIKLWHFRDREVHTVDLVGHGGGGRFKLGDELLFASDGTGLELVDGWTPFLSERATLRLLGCSVASESNSTAFDGPSLLQQLDARLGGQRRALAPTRTLFSIDYRADGLSPRAQRSLAGSTNPRSTHGKPRQPEQEQRNH